MGLYNPVGSYFKYDLKEAAAMDVTSPSDSVIGSNFENLTAEEQEQQREEWKAELKRTEEEILTLKQVLLTKEKQAAGLKRRLGITQWREFSDDMAQGLKKVQESEPYKKTAETIELAKEKTTDLISSIGSSDAWNNVSSSLTSAYDAAKSKISNTTSSQSVDGAQQQQKTTT